MFSPIDALLRLARRESPWRAGFLVPKGYFAPSTAAADATFAATALRQNPARIRESEGCPAS
jgi:hypothetical protein